MIKKIKTIYILLLLSNFSYCQVDSTDVYNVGFRYFKTKDNSRKHIINHDTVNRPMLIHYWYPCQVDSELNNMSFKFYIDLIAIREDFDKEQQEINNMTDGFINAYLGFSKRKFGIDTLITTIDVLNSPVKAKFDALPIKDNFPLIVYAPSNSKSSVQNHIICEYLASNGYQVISVGSAGDESLKRNDEIKSTLAQVYDMEFVVRFISDSLKTEFSSIGLLGFSSGSMATVIYQIRNPEVKAVVSLDGSHEYSSYLNLSKIEDFDLKKANVAYCIFANNYKDFSIYPYYSSITVRDKYLFKMSYLNHNGFISYWKQFDMCTNGESINIISESYDLLCKQVNGFFDYTLKSNLKGSEGFEVSNNRLIQKDTTDYSVIATLLNLILKDGIDSSISNIKDNKKLYADKNNLINILGRLYIGNDNSTACKIFLANAEIHPNSWEVYYNLAYVYKKSNNIEAAKSAITKAKNIDKDNSDVQTLFDEIVKLQAE